MSDSRILPGSTLDTYRADIKRANDNDLGHVWLWRAQELLTHIDAERGGCAEAKAQELREAADDIEQEADRRDHGIPHYNVKAQAASVGKMNGLDMAATRLRARADRIEKEQDRD